MRRRLALLWFVMALLVFSVTIVSAQTNQVVESFVVDGQTHLLQYPQSYAAQSATIEAAVAALVPAYERYWNVTSSGASAGSMDFRTFIDVGMPQGANPDPSNVQIQSVALPLPSSPWNGKSEAAKTTVCAVQLFSSTNTFATPQRLQFELALDLAQCYINHYANPGANPPDWWFKGISYWMAVQVYPPPTDVLVKLQADYRDNYNANLLNAGEESLYFWEYLLGSNVPAAIKRSIPGSPPAVVNGLKNLSGTVTYFTPELFYVYAQSVNANQLPWQPPPDAIAQDETVSFFPDDVDLELEENSIVIESVDLPKLESDEGIAIKAEDLDDNGVIASISAGDKGSFMLKDGASVQICDPPDSLTIVAGRGPTSQGSDAGLTFSKVEHCNATPEATAETTEEAGLPACVVGTWNVQFPFMVALFQMSGVWQYNFNPDGSFDLTAQELTATNRTVSIVLSFDFKGEIGLEADPKVENRYSVTHYSTVLQPGASAIGTGVDGLKLDETSTLTTGNSQLVSPPIAVTCAEAGADNPTVNLAVAGGQYTYVLSRAASAATEEATETAK